MAMELNNHDYSFHCLKIDRFLCGIMHLNSNIILNEFENMPGQMEYCVNGTRETTKKNGIAIILRSGLRVISSSASFLLSNGYLQSCFSFHFLLGAHISRRAATLYVYMFAMNIICIFGYDGLCSQYSFILTSFAHIFIWA